MNDEAFIPNVDEQEKRELLVLPEYYMNSHINLKIPRWEATPMMNHLGDLLGEIDD